MTTTPIESDPDVDDGFDEPDPDSEGDDSELSDRYGGSNHAPS